MDDDELNEWTIAEGLRKASSHLTRAATNDDARFAIARKILEQFKLSGVRLSRVSKWHDRPRD